MEFDNEVARWGVELSRRAYGLYVFLASSRSLLQKAFSNHLLIRPTISKKIFICLESRLSGILSLGTRQSAFGAI